MTQNGDEEPLVKPVAPPQKVAIFIGYILCIAAFICAVMWSNSHNKNDKYLGGLNWEDKVFNWHVVCMVGYVVASAIALMIYRWLPLGKPMNKALHVVFHTIALASLIIGVVAVFKSHNTKVATGGGYFANLYSLHSWLGLATIVCAGQNYILGLFHFLFPALSHELKKSYLPSHVFLGMFAFVAAVITAETGIMQKNVFIGCTYTVDEKDTNPAEHYDDIPEGCRLSNGIGLLILSTALCVLYGLQNLVAGNGKPTFEDSLLAGSKL